MARRPLEREQVYLDGGRRTTQLMRDSLGCAPYLSTMDILGRKDRSLRELVSDLAERLPPRSFIVVDHWEADPFAIGLARPSDPDHLVYITSDRDVHGRYFMSRELPSDSDLVPYREAGADQFHDVGALADAIAAHLGAA